MEHFQKNISSLSKTNPSLAQKLSNIKDVEDFEIFMDDGVVESLNFIDKNNFIPLYEKTPKETTKEQIKVLQKYKNYPYLYFYGLGNGSVIEKQLRNSNLKRLVVIEPELELLYVVLHFYNFSQDILDKRLQLFYAEKFNYHNARSLFTRLDEQRYVKVYDLHINGSLYEKKYHESIVWTNRTLIESAYYLIHEAGNDTKDSLIGLKHHIMNIPKLLETPSFVELKKKLKIDNPAVLVSTGPSLNKQLPLLKEIEPYVRIIAVDASFPVLYNAGIKPDVVVSIERVVESAKFFQDLPKEAFDDVIFALSSLQHQEVIDSIKGGTLQISLRPLGYMFETGPEDWGYVGIGTSAANMGFELAIYSGFKNIILIGQDLAYAEDGSSHAKGHVFGENNVKEQDNDVWIEGWGRKNKVKTNHNWVMFRKFFEKHIADIGESIKIINATEGGASIKGSTEISFKEAAEKYIDKKDNKKTMTLHHGRKDKIDAISIQTDEKVNEILRYTKNLLEEVKSLFLELADMYEKKEKKAKKIEKSIAKVNKIKYKNSDKIYDNVIWHIAQSMLLVQEIEVAPTEIYIPKNEQEKQEKYQQLIVQHKNWLFSFASILDAIVKTVDFAKVRRLIDEVDTIEVSLENKKIDSFTCKELTPEVGRVFDVDMRGILYDVPDEFQSKIDEIVFKDAKSGKELPKAFVDVIKRDDEKYNELSFMKSLEEPVDEEKIKDMYCPNAIGFLATEENLEDEEFVGYIKELMERFPDVEFKGFGFSNKSHKLIKNIFPIKDVNEIKKSIEIFLWNYKKGDLLTPKILNNIRSNDILSTIFMDSVKKITIKEWEEKKENTNIQNIKNNLEYFGFTKEEYIKSKKSVLIMINNRAKHFISKNVWKKIELKTTIYDFLNIEFVAYCLDSSEFKSLFFDVIYEKNNILL